MVFPIAALYLAGIGFQEPFPAAAKDEEMFHEKFIREVQGPDSQLQAAEIGVLSSEKWHTN